MYIPRGNLESRIERAVPRPRTPIVLYCASGNRSAYSAKTLAELGYTDVVSMAGGFSRWKQNGHRGGCRGRCRPAASATAATR